MGGAVATGRRILLLWMVGAGAPAGAADIPELGPPLVMPGMAVYQVAERISFNGVPMHISGFTAPLSAEEVLAFYRRQWGGAEERQIVEKKVGRLHVLGGEHSGRYRSLQVWDQPQGSEGVLTVSAAGDAMNPSRATELPLMPGTEILSTIASVDGDRRAESLFAVNASLLGVNARWLDGQFTVAGWVLVEDRQVEEPGARVLLFRRDREWCEVRLLREGAVRQGRTTLLYNRVEE